METNARLNPSSRSMSLATLLLHICVIASLAWAAGCSPPADPRPRLNDWDTLLLAATESYLLEPGAQLGMDAFVPPRRDNSYIGITLDLMAEQPDKVYETKCVIDSLKIDPIFASPDSFNLDTTYTYFGRPLMVKKFFGGYVKDYRALGEAFQQHSPNNNSFRGIYSPWGIVMSKDGRFGIVILAYVGNDTSPDYILMYRETHKSAWRKIDKSIPGIGYDSNDINWFNYCD